jgi:hypothetical protein
MLHDGSSGIILSENGKGIPKGLKTLILLLWTIFGLALNFLYGAYVVVPALQAETATMMTWVNWIILTVFILIIGTLMMLSKSILKLLAKIEAYIEEE